MTAPAWSPGETMAEYLADPGIGSSLLRALNERDRRPAHVKWSVDNPKPETDTQRLGRAIHTAVLEPDLFGSEYVTAGQCTGEVQSGPRKGQQCKNAGTRLSTQFGWRCGSHSKSLEQFDETKTVLTPEDWTKVIGMQNAVKAHPRAGKIVGHKDGIVEQSGYWDDPVTGLRLKIRPDLLIADHGIEVSLKTTKNASDEGWRWEMEKYHYHMSGAHYRDGCRALGFPWQRQLFVLVENFEPFLVNVQEIGPMSMEEGERLNRKWLDVWAECLSTGEFPGYDVQIKTTELPERYWNRLIYSEEAT